MPEGPSIVILREQATRFVGHEVRRAEGNAKIEMARLKGETLSEWLSYGKESLLVFDGFYLRIHLLLYGRYLIDEARDTPPRLHLGFGRAGEINVYNGSVKLLEGDPRAIYDWRHDIMADAWDGVLARKLMAKHPGALICDALLDQEVFAGSGNIIKNEVLFRCKVHPLSTVGAIPARRLTAIIAQVRSYAFEFLAWRKANVLRAHWQVHNKGRCPIHDVPLKRAHLGQRHRRSFWCERCQKLYGDDVPHETQAQ